MSNTPSDSVFDNPSSAPGRQPEATSGFGSPGSSVPLDENDAVESANAEIEFVSSAIKDLQDRLDRANDQMGHVAAVRTTEVEIGRLFVEAQRFTDASLANLEQQVHAILLQAEAKAQEILREANEEAEEIRRGAQSSTAIPAETAHELQVAIAGFSQINGELVKELEALSAMLTPAGQPEFGSAAAPSPAIGAS
jgi:hypothetical protein